MSGMTKLKCTLRQAREFVPEILEAGLVPFLKSSPGMGKSAMMASVADQFNLELLDTRLSTCAPTDLSGIPKLGERTAQFIPFENFPVEGTPLPGQERVQDPDTGEWKWTDPTKNGWLIFLDEFNSGSKSTLAASYKLLLDKAVGLRKLHPNVVIALAGNLDSDRAITTQIGTALQRRVITLELELNFDEFMLDVALPQNWDSRIIAYLHYNQGALHDFRPDHTDHTFCCPATWEFMDKLIKGKTFNIIQKFDDRGNPFDFYEMEAKAPLYAGTITSGEATKFIQFTKVMHSMPKLADILRNPTGIALPVDNAVLWNVTTYLLDNLDNNNFQGIADYINRFSSEFRILFMRSIKIKKPELLQNPALRHMKLELAKYLND